MAGPVPEGQVAVLDPQGRYGHIPSDQLASAQSQGYAVASQQQIDEANKSDLYKVGESLYNIGDTAEAGLHGILRGATAGLSDLAGKKLRDVTEGASSGEQFANEIARMKAEHPTASTAGEVTGMVGGALTGGAEAGLAARLSPMGLIGAAGDVAERGLGRLGAESVLGRAALKGAKLAVRGGVENALYSGVQEVSEESLGKPELNAEKIFAATAHGAEGGALLGGALGVGGSLIGSGLGGLANVASRNADKLSSMANEQRWRALDPLKKFTEQVNARVEGGTDAAGEVLGKYSIVPSDIAGAAREGNIEAIAPKIDTALEAVGKRLGELHETSGAELSLKSIDDAFEKTVAPLRRKGGFDNIVNSLDAYKKSLYEKLVPNWEELTTKGPIDTAEINVPIQDAIFQRKALDQLVYKETKALDPNLRVEALRDMRAGFEDVIVNAFDDAAKASGNPGAKAELLGLKKDYQVLSIAQDAAETSTSRMATNRNFSMSDYMSGGTGAHIGASIGGLVGGAPGAALGGMVGGAAGAAINRFGRERGNAIAAAALDRAAAFGGKARVSVRLPEAAQALEREAAAAEGGTIEKVAQALPTPGLEPEVRKPVPEAIANPKWDEKVSLEGLDKLGVSTLATPEEVAQAGKNVFGNKVPSPEFFRDMYQVPPGYKLKIKTLGPVEGHETFDTHKFAFDANILTEDNRPIGHVARTFERDAEGNLVVHHDVMRIVNDYQGKGIGTELSKSALEAYHQLGVHRIELDAALDVGPYAWARQGYQWKNPGQQYNLQSHVDTFAKDRGLSEPDTVALRKAIDTSPMAVSELGRGTSSHYGKDFLIDSGGWSGVLPVEAAHAAMLDKAAQFERAQHAIRQIDEKVDAAANGIVEGPNGRAREATKAPLKKRYEEAMTKVKDVQAQSDSLMARAAQHITHLPQTGQALGYATMRAASYLVSQVPAAGGQPTLGHALPTRVSDVAMSEFLQKAAVAQNPVSVLHSFASGRITQTQAMALQQVSPELFKELQAKALTVVQSKQAKGDPLPYDARQRMSILLGIITDPSQDPKMMAALQGNLAAKEEPKASAPPRAGKGPPIIQNKLDQLEER